MAFLAKWTFCTCFLAEPIWTKTTPQYLHLPLPKGSGITPVRSTSDSSSFPVKIENPFYVVGLFRCFLRICFLRESAFPNSCPHISQMTFFLKWMFWTCFLAEPKWVSMTPQYLHLPFPNGSRITPVVATSAISIFSVKEGPVLIDPRGRPTVTAGSDHYFSSWCLCPSHFSKSRKRKQTSSENSHCYWRDCGSGRVDHSCIY